MLKHSGKTAGVFSDALKLAPEPDLFRNNILDCKLWATVIHRVVQRTSGRLLMLLFNVWALYVLTSSPLLPGWTVTDSQAVSIHRLA